MGRIMKKLLTLTVLMMGFTFAVQANEREEMLLSCSGYSDIADMIMEDRQKGRTFKETLGSSVLILQAVGATTARQDDQFKEYLDNLILRAYSYPVYSSDKLKEETIKTFADKEYMHCYAGSKRP